MYGANDKNTYYYLGKFKSIVEKYNNKYSAIQVMVDKTYLHIKLRFFIKRQSVKQITKEIEVSINDSSYNKFTDQLTLKNDVNNNRVEIIVSKESILDYTSPDFTILAFYGLSVYNKHINIKEASDDVFCFDLDQEGGQGVVYQTRKFRG